MLQKCITGWWCIISRLMTVYKEIVPEILAGTPKSVGKNTKNSAIASFHGERSVHQVLKQDIERFSRKKILNIDQIEHTLRLDVT